MGATSAVVFLLLALLPNSVPAFCKPGATKKMGCMICTCLSDRKQHCDSSSCKMLKLKNKPNVKRSAVGRCRPGRTWHNACFYCFCLPDANMECSKKNSCKPGVLPGYCEPGTSWSESSCSRCTCFPDGRPTCDRSRCLSVGPQGR